jgi:hypothetical protein
MTAAVDTAGRRHDGHTNPGSDRAVATPAWMNTATRSLEAILSGSGHDLTGPAATLWPFVQNSNTATRAGRYLPATSRHPQPTRAALAAYVIAKYSRPGQVVFAGFVGSGIVLMYQVPSSKSRGRDRR